MSIEINFPENLTENEYKEMVSSLIHLVENKSLSEPQPHEEGFDGNNDTIVLLNDFKQLDNVPLDERKDACKILVNQLIDKRNFENQQFVKNIFKKAKDNGLMLDASDIFPSLQKTEINETDFITKKLELCSKLSTILRNKELTLTDLAKEVIILQDELNSLNSKI